MIVRLLKIALPLLCLGLGLGAYLHLRNANARLREQLATARIHDEQTAQVRNENREMEALVARAKADESGALRAIQTEVGRVRADVAELERKAEERYAAKLAKDREDKAALAENRDLTKGPVLLENCRNVGRATPVDALQTLIWAGMKGDDELVASMIALDGKTRAMVAALLAVLPARAREKYPTPEKLAALVFADVLMNVSAFQVVGQKAVDSQRVALTVAKLSGKTADIVMELGPNGWQVATTDKKIFEQFKARILGASPAEVEAKK